MMYTVDLALITKNKTKVYAVQARSLSECVCVIEIGQSLWGNLAESQRMSSDWVRFMVEDNSFYLVFCKLFSF
jgi:hypothetical protein